MKINYETKCRRCGRIIAWAGPEINNVDDLLYWKVEKMNYPMSDLCDTCGVQTVQDVVSFKEINK